MPEFRYKGRDAADRVVHGVVDAPSVPEARARLERQGVRLDELRPLPAGPPASPGPAAAPARRKAKRVKPGNDALTHFLLAQLEARIQAGIGVSAACQAVADTCRHSGYRACLLEAARETAAGGTLSDAFERYPGVFPAFVVGLVRVGERTGELPEALRTASDRAGDAHRFGRFFWWIGSLLVTGALLFPVLAAFRAGILRYADELESGRAGGFRLDEVVAALADALRGPLALQIGLFLLAFFSLRRWWASAAARPVRHRWALQVPLFGPRARHESLMVFCWALERSTRAGLAPQEAWRLAASAVPNIALARELLASGRRMGDATPLSEVAAACRWLPDTYAPLISTGEMTGTLPSMLERLAVSSRAEYESAQSYARFRGCGLAFALAAVIVGLGLAVLAWLWYRELPARLMEGLDSF